ncbi:MAG TPA: hypothetical protein PLB75_05465 [Paludibacteraceae bacterium]|jgi:NAD-dependent SIR2 family protein deacetylase|nr:hypothetical protein [Bacteroidales bacterium]HNY45162.1 hypothetical protein [Bacteroidales bacterium]HQC04916.1 hypothetical protein [Paludibacteraceae bacterium]
MSKDKTVYIIGAGFSKSANIPLQSELLDEIFKVKENDLLDEYDEYKDIFNQYRNAFKKFLSDTMFIEEKDFAKISLEDIYTPIDRCVVDNLAFRNISPKDLIDIRQKINGLIIMLLKRKTTKCDHVEKFTKYLINKKEEQKKDSFAIISTNWDILIDNSFKRNSKGVIDYCCHTTPYSGQNMPALVALTKNLFTIKLLKLHGSMNWLQCKRCQRLFVTFFEKIAIDEYINKPICKFCKENFKDENANGGALLSSQLIMPTFLKDLNNVQLKLIWQNAGIELSEASSIVFMGYSFPTADFELRQLLARNVRHSAKIEVVLCPSDKPTNDKDTNSPENRFKSFFGKREVNFYYEGVEEYIKTNYT